MGSRKLLYRCAYIITITKKFKSPPKKGTKVVDLHNLTEVSKMAGHRKPEMG